MRAAAADCLASFLFISSCAHTASASDLHTEGNSGCYGDVPLRIALLLLLGRFRAQYYVRK